jgi:hypothetical protein
MHTSSRTATALRQWQRGFILLSISLGAAAADDPAWTADARKVALSVPPKLLSTLQAAIDKDGHEGAIAVCRDEAPKLARAASEETGWAVRRVSLRQRNPKAVPDAWERAALEDFDRRAAAGESPARLEKAEVVVEGGQTWQRYMRALPVQQMCLACHGDAASLSPAVSARLQALYPQDQAVGYSVGQTRGAMTIKRPQ